MTDAGTFGRPELEPTLTADEFQRWYWLKRELQAFARRLGLNTGGSKDELTAKISNFLAGGTPAAPPLRRQPTSGQLNGRLTAATVIPPGQRCSQLLRAWFDEHTGAGFRFDAPMREFIASATGEQTLGDALQHWHATRQRSPAQPAAQFEFNRFTRAWHEAHPAGDRTALSAAWAHYRSTPIDVRGRI